MNDTILWWCLGAIFLGPPLAGVLLWILRAALEGQALAWVVLVGLLGGGYYLWNVRGHDLPKPSASATPAPVRVPVRP